jgi:hypothetical protein
MPSFSSAEATPPAVKLRSGLDEAWQVAYLQTALCTLRRGRTRG